MPAEVASRELRNNTAGLLRRVQAGEDITITANGKPVALLTAGSPHGADGLVETSCCGGFGIRKQMRDCTRDLATLTGDTTDDLGPVR